MNLKELKIRVEEIIKDLKDNGNFPNENHTIDYKLKLNMDSSKDALTNFMINFTKDILSFSNSDGGIILLGIKEDDSSGAYEEVGLDQNNVALLKKIDLNLVSQKYEKICKVGLNIDLQSFKIGTKVFYYILVEKQSNVLVPINDFKEYKLNKGDILYRASGKNEIANNSTTDFNRFLQIKSNEKSKEFMDIWSKLLPEMFDINPREVLILNPISNKVYGFNAKDKVLSSSDIDIDHEDNGVFNIILNAISAGDIGKISNDEGKPIYKIVGELKAKSSRDFIYFTSLIEKIKNKTDYNFSSNQLKSVFKYLKWINDDKIKIENPVENKINKDKSEFIWIEILDRTHKIVFSQNAVEPLVKAINESKNHIDIFGKVLQKKQLK
ncbi:ATP-binding protein [Flavobacterium sp.]|uniref:ATP-binding protein n=1 Tax=Flavobacterium sp. TaxID=239 RepID=UPI0040487B7A